MSTVWLRPLGGQWQAVGTMPGSRSWHEQLNLVSDEMGPKTATFTVKRGPRSMLPDLLARTPVAVDVAGQRVWRGWVSDAPEQDGEISVSCVGGQAHLDGVAFQRTLASAKLSRWQDIKGVSGADLSHFIGPGTVRAVSPSAINSSVIVLGFPLGATVTTGNASGVLLDLGPGQTAKRVVMTFNNAGCPASTYQLLVVGVDTPGDLITGGESAVVVDPNVGGGTEHGTFTTARRYLGIYLYRNAAGSTTISGDDQYVQVTAISAFADTAYESGDVSILTPDLIIRDALTNGTSLLSADRSQIGTPAVAFPDFAPDSPQTAQQIITTANSPVGWRFKIDENLRPVYRARPTAPVVDLGAWRGTESRGVSSNSDEGVVTTVTVTGQDITGQAVSVTHTQTGTIVDRQGDAQSASVEVGFTITAALAAQFADTYLATHRASPLKGTSQVSHGGARRSIGGAPVHPAHLLLYTTELARRTDLIDPDTGAVGRNATITQVTYNDEAGTANVDLDNTRTDFDTELARRGVLTSAS